MHSGQRGSTRDIAEPECYPAIAPYAHGWLPVGDGNHLYWETCGNPDGKPVVVLHGGPGSGSAPLSRQHFDPTVYRIVVFDQRGAGKSMPHVTERGADLSTNTTWHLVADMEWLRQHLNIRRWQLFGGSWGATLALAYAETHPDRVTEIVLRGVFTARRSELDWIYNGGAAHLFPREWEDFLAPIPHAQRGDPINAYLRLLEEPTSSRAAALAWSAWEGSIVSVVPQQSLRAGYSEPMFAAAFARIALHHFTHRAWLADGQLIRDAGLLAGIPGVIVQGRYDAVCPPSTAYQLHTAWPGSRLDIVEGAGHAVSDPGIIRALTNATDLFAGR